MRFTLTAMILFSFLAGGCGPAPDRGQGVQEQPREEPEPVEPEFPLTFDGLPGTWQLMYGGDYGYDFRLRANNQAWVILYLQDSALVFKGIYTIDEGNKLRVNITEMKNVNSVHDIGLYGGFSKANSSYFLFKGSFRGEGRKKILRLVPERIIIDGNNSDGYFEPVIRLKRL